MIRSIIQFSIKNKFIIGLFVLAIVGAGTWSLTTLPVDAIPDITNNQIQIISIAPSLAVQEVEGFITSPIEVAVANIPDIIELRSISRLGLSVITVVFKDKTDIYWARQQLNERLHEAEENIPEGIAKIELAPVSTGLGEIFQYRLVVEKGLEQKYGPMELRTIQDWIVRRQMLGTPGVADINSYGGFVKQYEVAVNPERLTAMNLTLTDIFHALEQNNANTGSAYIDKNPNAYFIRGIGLVKTLEDIEKIVVKSTASGSPVLIRDVANVQFGNAIRYGAFVVDTAEAVGGVVMMLKGANAHQVIEDVETRIASIQKTLPEGITIEPFLNRTDLVGRAIGTVTENLIIGALIVIFVLILLLGNLRAGLIVASIIPLSMLFAISLMNLFGVSGNLMSLGAIDFGLIVDGAVIIVESVVHRIHLSSHKVQGNILTQQQMDENVLESSHWMMNSATFGQFIILIVYLPIMALIGIEGKMFRPMAQVVSFALLGAIILSLTYVPMASALFLSKKADHTTNISDRIVGWIQKRFQSVIGWSLQHKTMVTLIALVLFLFSVYIFSRLGGEFIPELEEGDLAAGVMTLQGGSLSNTIGQVEKANRILLTNFPEIKHAVCKIGAGEIPTDPTPMETGDYIITLKPKKEWESAKTREDLMALMEEKLVTLPGVKFEFQQPIQMRFNELMTGSRQDVAIKIFGDDLSVLAESAAEIEKLISNIQGVQDINVEKVTGLAQIQVEFNRDRLSQYGISVEEVNHVLGAAFAGSEAGIVFDGENRFNLVVRLDKNYRQSIDDVKELTVSLPDGEMISFDQIAEIRTKSGPAQVSRENARRRITVGFNVRNRDVQSVIQQVMERVDNRIKLPAGYSIDYGGEFRNLEAARKRLSIAVPMALLLIFVLLFFTFHSAKQALLIFTAVPLAAIGGIVALWMRNMNFSISAGVGFIALFGVAVLNGIVLIAEFNRLKNEGITDIYERVRKGLHTRLRPVIMTAAVASFGFLPMAISVSAGAEVQKPLATVVIGGLITSTILTLLVLPVFYVLFSTHSFRKKLKRMFSGSAVLPLVFICANLFFSNSNAQSPERLNQNECIKMALDSNMIVQTAAIEIQMHKALKGAAWDIPKTEVGVEYGQMNSNLKDNGITISQTFDFPTVYINQHKLANAGIRSSESQSATVKLDIATQVKLIYWQLAYLNSLKNLLLLQDSLYSGFAKAAERRSQTGETNRLEMMNARSQSLEVKNRLQEAVTDISIYGHKLQTILYCHHPVKIADTVLIRMDFTLFPDSQSLSANPSALYMKQQADIAKFERKVEYSKMMPDFTIGYFSQTIRGTQEINGIPHIIDGDKRFTGLQAGIAIPLWPVPHLSKAKASKMHQQIAETKAESFNRTLTEEYGVLLGEYSKFKSSLEYYEQQAIPEADIIINQTTISYKSGAMDYSDYILNMSHAVQIKERYLDALLNYNQSIIQIESITGKIY